MSNGRALLRMNKMYVKIRPMKHGSRGRRCSKPDAGMRKLGLLIYHHFTKGGRMRRSAV